MKKHAAFFPQIISGSIILALCMAVLSTFAASASTVNAQVLAPTYDPRPFGSTLEVHVNDNGTVTVHGARVEQLAGSTLFAKVYWGVSFIRLTVRTNNNTIFEKRFGQNMAVNEISIGDFISVHGTLFEGSNSLDVVATKVKDWSLQTMDETISGTIIDLATTTETQGFIVNTKNRGKVTLLVAISTPVNKGSLVLKSDVLGVGTRITSATGTYNNLKKTFDVRTIRIYQNSSLFQPRNFEGVIKSIDGNVLPVTMIVTVGGVDYTVPVGQGVSILNNKRAPLSIARFIKDDKVRFYGTIREATPNIVDVEIMRNLSL